MNSSRGLEQIGLLSIVPSREWLGQEDLLLHEQIISAA